MKGIKNKRLCLVFLLLFCLTFNSCKLSENILQSYSEVDFSTPQKVQISFNEHIYDTTIVLNTSKLEINFINEKDLISGAYICLTENKYKITYKDMAFEGERNSLTNSFLPCVVYSFLSSFGETIVLDNYDKERECYNIKKNINSYFVSLECYETDDNKFYSMEIK